MQCILCIKVQTKVYITYKKTTCIFFSKYKNEKSMKCMRLLKHNDNELKFSMLTMIKIERETLEKENVMTMCVICT